MLLFVLLLLFPPPILSAGEQDESFCLFSIGISPSETGSSLRGVRRSPTHAEEF